MMMKFSDEICQLVISHMDAIEEAPQVISEIENCLFGAIQDRIELLAKESWGEEMWADRGEADRRPRADKNWGLHGRMWFGPHKWSSEEDAGANLDLDFIRNRENVYKLSAALGVNGGQLRLCYVEKAPSLNNKEKKARVSQFYREQTSLESSGLQLFDDNVIGFCFTLDPEKVAEEYPNFDEALAPVNEAFNAFLKNHEIFDDYVKTLFELEKQKQ